MATTETTVKSRRVAERPVMSVSTSRTRWAVWERPAALLEGLGGLAYRFQDLTGLGLGHGLVMLPGFLFPFFFLLLLLGLLFLVLLVLFLLFFLLLVLLFLLGWRTHPGQR